MYWSEYSFYGLQALYDQPCSFTLTVVYSTPSSLASFPCLKSPCLTKTILLSYSPLTPGSKTNLVICSTDDFFALLAELRCLWGMPSLTTSKSGTLHTSLFISLWWFHLLHSTVTEITFLQAHLFILCLLSCIVSVVKEEIPLCFLYSLITRAQNSSWQIIKT